MSLPLTDSGQKQAVNAEAWLIAARGHHRLAREGPRPTAKALVAAACYHGLQSWLYRHARALDLDAATRDALNEVVMREVAFARMRAARARELCQSFEALGAPSLVLKGAAHAETLYERRWHRPSGDLDVLVPQAHAFDVAHWLRANGWMEQVNMTASRTTSQSSWRHPSDAVPIAITLDLHWQVSDAHWFAMNAPFETLYATSEIVPGSALRWLGRVNALLHACAHRAMHLRASPVHFDGTSDAVHERQIWLEDIRLLVLSMNGDETRLVSETARANKLSKVVRDAIAHAFAAVDETPPFNLPEPAQFEPGQLVLRAGAAGTLAADLIALPGMASRMRYLRGHLFPSATYMRQRFKTHAALPVAFLHLWRLLRGMARFATRSLPRT